MNPHKKLLNICLKAVAGDSYKALSLNKLDMSRKRKIRFLILPINHKLSNPYAPCFVWFLVQKPHNSNKSLEFNSLRLGGG